MSIRLYGGVFLLVFFWVFLIMERRVLGGGLGVFFLVTFFVSSGHIIHVFILFACIKFEF